MIKEYGNVEVNRVEKDIAMKTVRSHSSDMLWLNDMRILAAIAIIMVHVSQPFAYLAKGKEFNEWWIPNLYLSVNMWGVPVFVMISGALLLSLEREYASYAGFYRKRLNKLALPVVFWTIFYLILQFIKGGHTGVAFGFNELQQMLLQGRPYYHMWYLYMIWGLYLITPFMRTLIQYSSRKELIWLAFILMFLSNIATNYTDPHVQPVFILLFPFYLGYFLTGYLISTSKIKIPVKYLMVVFILLAIVITIGEYNFPNRFHANLTITMIIMSITLMFIVKKIHHKIPISSNIRNQLATFSLGAYLIHPAVLVVIRKLDYFGLNTEDNLWIFIPLIIFVTTVISVIIAYIFSKIPLLKKVI